MKSCAVSVETPNVAALLVIQHAQPFILPAGLLHTIIFSRALGQVKPQEEDSEIFDITYVSATLPLCRNPQTTAFSKHRRAALQVTCGSPLVQQKIEEGIDSFHSWVDKHTGKRGQVAC